MQAILSLVEIVFYLMAIGFYAVAVHHQGKIWVKRTRQLLWYERIAVLCLVVAFVSELFRASLPGMFGELPYFLASLGLLLMAVGGYNYARELSHDKV